MTTNSLDITKVNEQTDRHLKIANNLVINSQESFSSAGNILKSIVGLKKEIEGHHKPIIELAYKTHKTAKAQEKIHTGPLIKSEQVIKVKMGTFLAEQKRIADKKRADDEEILRKQEEEKNIQEASKLEANGQTEEAEQVINRPVQVHIPRAPVVDKVQGISSKVKWDFKIVNGGLIPNQFLIPDEKKIRAYVQAFKHEAIIKGVIVFQKNEINVRA